MNKSLRGLLEEWGRLLAAVRAGEVDLPVLTPYRVALEGHLENLKAARARQLALREDYRQATREVRQRLLAGSDEVRRLRSRVKAELGPRDARLRLFGIKPLDIGSRGQGCRPRTLAPD
ncbi:MAG TPA: hypothetical protein VKK31_23720 [Thermoanaerobaculia bacterium]|nr:hypothetical protein [Thermoanaerobaculia bacterium]